MKKYLLALDGSRQSMHAAEVAWRLAEKDDAKVIAQTVIDTESSWALLAPGEPGLIGSSPYVEARECLIVSLRSIAESLLNSYETRVRGHKVASESVIDEGGIVDKILARAKDCDLVIIGHRRERRDDQCADSDGYGSYHVTERVARSCPKPVLVVQHEDKPWKGARLVVSPETFNQATLDAFLEFTSQRQMPLQIYCIGPDERMDELLAQVKRTVPKSAHARILTHDPAEGDDAFDCAVDVNSDTLLVITTKGKDNRRTCGGTSIESFVRAMTPAMILIWPSEMSQPAVSLSSARTQKEARSP